MPTYAYACTQCGHRFDAVQSFSDSSLTECPECGGALRKQYGSIGVTFNGSGFYRNDSRAGSSSGSKESSKAEKSTSGASTNTTSTSSTSSASGTSAPSSSSAS